MKSPNEFWLCAHRLLEAYVAEGRSPDERRENIVEQFCQMPPIAQREVLGELVQLVMHLPELYPAVLAASHARDEQPKFHGNVA